MVSDDPIARASGWLSSVSQHRPEALLLVAAGIALLMRRGASNVSPVTSSRSHKLSEYYGNATSSDRARSARRANPAAFAADRAAAGVSGLADDLSAKAASLSDTVNGYVNDASERMTSVVQGYSDDVTKHVRTVNDMIDERPLLVAVAGIVAGAAMAAIAPMTRSENLAFQDMRTRVGAAASQLSDNVKDAAFEATQNVKREIQENGLSTDGIKGALRDAADSLVSSSKESVNVMSSTEKTSS